MEIKIEGILTGKIYNRYELTNGSENFSFYYSEELNIGQQGSFTLIKDVKGYKCTEYNEKQVFEQLYLKLFQSLNSKNKEWLIKNDVAKRLNEHGILIIKHLIVSQKLGRKIIVRFHNDADGIAGGMAIQKLLGNILNYQNKGPIYSPDFAISDLSLLNNSFKPMVLLIDFGSTTESEEGLKLLKAAGIEVIIIDHHPYDKIPEIDHYLSPWMYNGDSYYPAGYIVCELASQFIENDKDAQLLDRLKRISLAGDKSKYYTPSEDEKKTAIILDYIATYSRFPNTLKFYDTVFEDENIMHSIGLTAEEKIEDIKQTAKHYIKEKDAGNIKIVLLQIDKLVNKHGFPSKSKATGAVFEMYDQCVLIAHGKKLITLRITPSLNISAREIIKTMKEKFPQGIISGGGHDVAASMRCDPDMTKIIVNEIIDYVKLAQQ